MSVVRKMDLHPLILLEILYQYLWVHLKNSYSKNLDDIA